ncbi:MAG TPA: hypothetical protein VFA70_04825, partial [Dehalococcoidia bacterium]|nr:hypothetical protein [Dehalococcoidia bacterium]
MADGDGGSLTELVFLHRGPLVLRAAAVVLVAIGVGIAGVLLADAHIALAARSDVASLNPVQRLLRSGSSALTAWPGWLGAAVFAVSVLRLRRGPMEPAPTRRRVEELTPAQLRSGLRAEYRGARWLLCVVLVVAAIDAARAIATTY